MKVVSIYLVSGLCVRLLADEDRANELLGIMNIDKQFIYEVSSSFRVNNDHITHIEISDTEVKEEVTPEIVGD